jgi:hypothetical protein
MSGGWRTLLEQARRPVSAGQAVWDGHWARWLAIARALRPCTGLDRHNQQRENQT